MDASPAVAAAEVVKIGDRLRHARRKQAGGHAREVLTAAWSAKGRWLATGSDDAAIKIWKVSDSGTATEHRTLRGHTAKVKQVSWSPVKEHHLASVSSADKSLRIWDADSGTARASVTTLGENLYVMWSPDGRHIAFSDKSDLLCIAEPRHGNIVARLQYEFQINEMSWVPDHPGLIAHAGRDDEGGVLALTHWTGQALTPVAKLHAHTAACSCLHAPPRGGRLVVGSADAAVSVWEAAGMTCERVVDRGDVPLRAVRVSGCGRMLASDVARPAREASAEGGEVDHSVDPGIDVTDLATGSRVAFLPVDKPILALAWHPTKPLLAFAVKGAGDSSLTIVSGVA